MKTEEEKAAEAYRSTLNELESNSKPQINCLTMLAEDSKEYAVQIAACIENQLKSVPNKRKLPVLYLIDSICKNFPKSVYVQLFTQNIVSNFCNVFEVSDEKVRKSLHKLRMTWNTTKIFPQKKLNAIDERVHEMDPNWPILYKISQQRQALPQTSQQQQQQQQQQQVQQSHSKQQAPQTRNNRQANSNNNNNNIINNTNNKLHNAGVKRLNNNNGQSTGGGGGKRKRSKSSQNRNNQQQSQKLVKNAEQPVQPTVLVAQPQTFIDPALIQAAHDLPQVLPTTYMDPSITIASSDHLIHQVPTATYLNPGTMLIASTQSNEPQLASQMICTPYSTGPPPTQTAQPNQAQHQQSQQQQLQPKQQQPEAVQSPHLYILESLYGGKQCSNCSLRFDDNDKSYDHHLDWHFRQRVKSESMFARRKWYYPLNLWVQFREINDDEHQENNNTDSNVNELLIPVNDHEVPTAPASKDDAKNICSVCHETFEKFWAEEEEEWRLRNARLYEDERVYHPLCLKDYITS